MIKFNMIGVIREVRPAYTGAQETHTPPARRFSKSFLEEKANLSWRCRIMARQQDEGWKCVQTENLSPQATAPEKCPKQRCSECSGIWHATWAWESEILLSFLFYLV